MLEFGFNVEVGQGGIEVSIGALQVGGLGGSVGDLNSLVIDDLKSNFVFLEAGSRVLDGSVIRGQDANLGGEELEEIRSSLVRAL